eukprot:scaffold48601_cov49-Phaeocystis_antarctica.AAC.2
MGRPRQERFNWAQGWVGEGSCLGGKATAGDGPPKRAAAKVRCGLVHVIEHQPRPVLNTIKAVHYEAPRFSVQPRPKTCGQHLRASRARRVTGPGVDPPGQSGC